jgi:23S rRNA (cytidine1920-2'-O)/16S rRNA (cytidine1409-2'-O)-methyltransferase
MTRSRLDQELVERGLVATRSRARRAIRDGLVVVDGATVQRPGVAVKPATVIEVAESVGRYVGQGAHKLQAALVAFQIEVDGRYAIDVGASTGGFTDVLLQHNARRVVAVDVGHGQLHQRLRSDSRVDVREDVNIRHAKATDLGGPFDLIVADLSFISLRMVARPIADLGASDSDWVMLVKPQFEVGRNDIGKGGVVRSATARGQAVADAANSFAESGLVTVGAVASPVPGGSGNREALLWMRRAGLPVRRAELIKVLADE